MKIKKMSQIFYFILFSTSSLGVVTLLPSDHVTFINFHISSYSEATGLQSSTQTLKSPSISCFKYFATIEFCKFCKKDKCSCGCWPPCWLWYLNMKQANFSTNFDFLEFFSDTKTYFSRHHSCSIKKLCLKLLEYSQQTVF